MQSLSKANKRFAVFGCMIMFTLGFEIAGFQAVLLDIAQEFSMNNTQMGMLAAVQSVASVISTLSFGGLADKMHKKKAVALFGCVLMTGIILAAFSGSALMIGSSIFVLGLGFSMVEGTTPATLCELNPHKSAMYTNLAHTCYSLGAVTSPLIVQALMSAGMNWRGHFWIALALVALVMSLFYFTKNTVHPDALALKEKAGEKGKGDFKAVACGALFLIVGSMAIYVAMESGQIYFTKPYFIEELHDSRNAALSISLIWACMIPSRLLASRIHRRKGLFISLCFAVAAAACFLKATLRTSGMALLWSGLFGLAAGPIFPTAQSVCMDTFPGHTGRVSNLTLTAGSAGGMLANISMGAAGDAFGLGNAYYIVALLALSGILVFGLGFKKAEIRRRKYYDSL